MKEFCFFMFIVFLVSTMILEFIGIIMTIRNKETIKLLGYSLLTFMLSSIFLLLSKLFSQF